MSTGSSSSSPVSTRSRARVAVTTAPHPSGCSMPASRRPPGEVVPVGRLLVHVTVATAHAERLGAAPQLSVNVLNKVAEALVDAGQLDTSRPLMDRALQIARAQLGPDHPATLTTRNNLASWLGRA